eukprot:Nk52_evm1s1245 gene=Nk52_evmTU1s1245
MLPPQGCSSAALGQGRGRQPVGAEQLGDVGEPGGVAAHGVGGRGDPLDHHLADLFLDGVLGVGDVPGRDLVVAVGAPGDLPARDAGEAGLMEDADPGLGARLSATGKGLAGVQADRGDG